VLRGARTLPAEALGARLRAAVDVELLVVAMGRSDTFDAGRRAPALTAEDDDAPTLTRP
jgi:hypothetical protein